MRPLFAVVAFALGAATAAPVPKELKKEDDKVAIVGKWEVARANVNGAEVAKYSPEHTVTFTAEGTATFQYPNIPDQPNDFTLDTAASPKTMSFLRNAKAVGQPRPYEFRNGRLVVVIPMGNVPAKSLEPGPDLIVIEYKRAEKK